MKRLLMITILLALCTRSRAQDESAEEENKDGKVKYALILPEEKTPELVKPNEASPFGGIQDEKSKDTASGEEAKVSDMLRALPVVGKSSRNCVLLGDIILRKGQIVPPIIPNQTVQLMVRDISPEKIELVWVEKKPTGLNPRILTILTDVSPQVKQRLPGSFGGGKGSGSPVMAIVGKSSPSVEPAKSSPRAQALAEETPPEKSPDAASGSQPASPGSALLNLFFGNQVKEPVKSPALKPVEEEDQRENHVPKP